MHNQNFYWQNGNALPSHPQFNFFYNPLTLSSYPPQIHNNLYNIITSTHPNSQLNPLFHHSSFNLIEPALLFNFPSSQPYLTPALSNTTVVEEQNQREAAGGQEEQPETVVKDEHQEEYRLGENVVPQRQNKRKYRHHRHNRRINASYYWSMEQNKRYYDFLKNYAHLFELTLTEKKNLRVNVMMSKKVKTRNSQQCHSHHQKMIKKYGSLERLLRQMHFEAPSREQHRPNLRKSKKGLTAQDQQESEFKI